eukprot:GFKZ01004272.1.p1 GENE.GFKZ01004272.1~~GFKZ01004272.1.p1  ORF type:complete len:487 (-),score=70.37 GFKZ01004272.1:391-1851(-)
MKSCLDKNGILIGYGGKDGLKDAFDEIGEDRKSALSFVKDFRDVHALNHASIKPVIPLLHLGGIPHQQVATEVRLAFIEVMKRQIQDLDQEQLDALLDKCYSFLTVPELAPIGISVLERLNFVDAGIWNQIVQNGLDESPYTDLPISIKKRIWRTEHSAFEHEVVEVIKRIPESRPPESLEHFLIHIDKHRVRGEDPILKDLVRLASNAEPELFTIIIGKFIESAKMEKKTSRRTTIANVFHDFVVFNSAGTHKFSDLRKMAKYMDTFDVGSTIEPSEEIDTIFDSVHDQSTRPMVSLLLASSYSRDFLAHMLVMQLLNRRGPLGDVRDDTAIANAAAHLRADPWISKLTFLCLCNIASGAIITDDKLPSDTDVSLPFSMFYPMIINEMDSDAVKFQDQYFTSNGIVPDSKFLDMVTVGTGVERRVMTTYCLQLFIHGNHVGLSRFRLVLDRAFRAVDPAEEVREAVLAFNLVGKILNELYPSMAA